MNLENDLNSGFVQKIFLNSIIFAFSKRKTSERNKYLLRKMSVSFGPQFSSALINWTAFVKTRHRLQRCPQISKNGNHCCSPEEVEKQWCD